DGIIFRFQGNSLILSRRWEWIIMIPWSVSFWLFFELINLRLENWHYINVMNNLALRWLDYFISFGTVLPGIFETYELLNFLEIFPKAKTRPLKIDQGYFLEFYLLGTTFILFPLIFPKYFFPFIWLALIFLLEPINYRYGSFSLLRNFEEGNFRPLVLLLTAGLICGFLWEFWNFWAKSKWIYTIPFFQQFKIFEMPLAGFLGFPPFAVEAFVFYNFISIFRFKRNWDKYNYLKSQNKKISIYLKAVLVISFLTFWALCFHYIDLHTVKSFSS
ncbi:MAG: hypothetical protein N3A64_01810, partial [Desulfobacterota bacterium]|nr:hypothetical protein [Thermodesulfobacteriota bacterium]